MPPPVLIILFTFSFSSVVAAKIFARSSQGCRIRGLQLVEQHDKIFQEVRRVMGSWGRFSYADIPFSLSANKSERRFRSIIKGIDPGGAIEGAELDASRDAWPYNWHCHIIRWPFLVFLKLVSWGSQIVQHRGSCKSPANRAGTRWRADPERKPRGCRGKRWFDIPIWCTRSSGTCFILMFLIICFPKFH